MCYVAQWCFDVGRCNMGDPQVFGNEDLLWGKQCGLTA